MSSESDENLSQDDNAEDKEEEKLFKVEIAKTGRAKCKKCKNVIDAGTVRLAKMVMNPFGSGKMPAWYHVNCLFEAFKKQRATTPKIENIDDIDGYENLSDSEIEEILKYLSDGKITNIHDGHHMSIHALNLIDFFQMLVLDGII